MDSNNENFTKITTQKEYDEIRGDSHFLDSMILFFCYDPNSDNTTWMDFLNDINENYQKFIKIIFVNIKSINLL